jgi:hypothetical protein
MITNISHQNWRHIARNLMEMRGGQVSRQTGAMDSTVSA